jgi:hypothetical protein
VFEGGGFGVGVTVTPLEVEPWPVEFLPAGVSARPTRLGEMMPVAARTDAEIAVEVQRVQQLEARLAAYTAELVAELAARRPDSLDRQLGEPGADHVVPHGNSGAIACENLCCLCRRHHRLKTHAPGWRFRMSCDGVLRVTTPSGVTRTTRPPGLTEPASDPPWRDDGPPPF